MEENAHEIEFTEGQRQVVGCQAVIERIVIHGEHARQGPIGHKAGSHLRRCIESHGQLAKEWVLIQFCCDHVVFVQPAAEFLSKGLRAVSLEYTVPSITHMAETSKQGGRKTVKKGRNMITVETKRPYAMECRESPALT